MKWDARAGNAAQRWGGLAQSSYYLSFAFWYAATTLFAIVNFAWRQPMFDQWREYETLLNLPFPQNVLQPANGHRPIVPNLLRVAEIRWFHANQFLQLSVGTAAALMCAAILATAAFRELSLPKPARCAAVMVSVIGILWLADARRLVHGSEALHGFLPTLATLTAVLCACRAHSGRRVAWIVLASIACVIATFSFGPGLAAFAALLLAMVLMRLPWQLILIPLAMFVVSLAAYVRLLPGAAVVVWSALEPITFFGELARWMASPWYYAILQFDVAQPVSGPIGGAQAAVSAAARGIHALTDIDTACLLLGLLGCASLVAMVIRQYRSNDRATTLEVLAASTAIYALGGGVITVIGRFDYFQSHPDQIYGDRYLLWPALFWACLALLCLVRSVRGAWAVPRHAATVVAGLLPLAMLPAQNSGAIWSAIVHRSGQQAAAALRSGVYDEHGFPSDGLGRDADLRQIALLRRHDLAMFADRAWHRIGERWTGSLEREHGIAVETRWLAGVDERAHGAVLHLEGWVKTGIAAAQQSGQLAVLSRDRMILGFGEFGFIRPFAPALRLDAPRKRGFDAFVRERNAEQDYILALLDFTTNRGVELASLIAPPVAIP